MKEELFTMRPSLSPRLRWLERNGVKTQQTPDWTPGMEDEIEGEVCEWYASSDGWQNSHGGATEDDAITALARAIGIRLWNEEQGKETA